MFDALIIDGESKLPPVNGFVPKFQSLVEFHWAKTQFGFAVVPMFWKTILSCSPFGPIADDHCDADGTPVTLKSEAPVSASNSRPKLDVARIAGNTPCWLGSSWSQIKANDIDGRSDLDQINSPVLRSTQSNGPEFEPVKAIGSLK